MLSTREGLRGVHIASGSVGYRWLPCAWWIWRLDRRRGRSRCVILLILAAGVGLVALKLRPQAGGRAPTPREPRQQKRYIGFHEDRDEELSDAEVLQRVRGEPSK
jgi:hypothetical protein